MTFALYSCYFKDQVTPCVANAEKECLCFSPPLMLSRVSIPTSLLALLRSPLGPTRQWTSNELLSTYYYILGEPQVNHNRFQQNL